MEKHNSIGSLNKFALDNDMNTDHQETIDEYTKLLSENYRIVHNIAERAIIDSDIVKTEVNHTN